MAMPRYLKQIGLRFFITHYEYLAQKSNRTEAIAYFVDNNFCSEGGASFRVSAAQCLLGSPELLQEALEYIAYKYKTSTLEGQKQKQKAKSLLNNMQCNVM